MSQSLLHTPEGVRDIYGQEYYNKAYVQHKMRKVISQFGYETIVTPTFEFFDVFSKEVGTIPSKDLYKFFDTENNTLVLRPDFTPSIARCAAKYFLENNDAIRFSYQGSAFARTNSHQGKLSESTELGAELIGDASVYADGEVIALAIRSLLASGLKDFRVSIGHIGYFKGLCEQAGLDESTELELRGLISGKNHFAAMALIDKTDIEPVIKEKLLGIADSFPDIDTLASAKDNVTNTRSLEAINRLEALYNVLKAYGYESYINFDLSMLSKYNYYTGVIFRVYTYGVGKPIVKGGRYDNLLAHFGKSAAAIGFVLQVDDILEAINSQKIELPAKDEPVVIEFDANDADGFSKALSKADELRQQGKKVVLNHN